jgi:alanine racemase
MSRLGFLCSGAHFDEGVAAVVRSCRMPGLYPEGIFTHFAVSDEPGEDNREYTLGQFDLFCRVIRRVRRGGRAL